MLTNLYELAASLPRSHRRFYGGRRRWRDRLPPLKLSQGQNLRPPPKRNLGPLHRRHPRRHPRRQAPLRVRQVSPGLVLILRTRPKHLPLLTRVSKARPRCRLPPKETTGTTPSTFRTRRLLRQFLRRVHIATALQAQPSIQLVLARLRHAPGRSRRRAYTGLAWVGPCSCPGPGAQLKNRKAAKTVMRMRGLQAGRLNQSHFWRY